jgi:ankyrin repeat protein
VADLKLFHDHIKSGNLASVRAMLAEDPSLLDQRNESGQPAFLLASYYQQADVADYLLTLKPYLDVYLATVAGRVDEMLAALDSDHSLLESHSSDGWTPLHLAAFFGRQEAAAALLARGANVDSRSTNHMRNTPLHAAAAGRRFPLVQLLLRNGADVNATQSGGWTALHGAAQSGDPALVQLLLAHQAHVHPRAENGQTALDLALLKGHQEIAELLGQL